MDMYGELILEHSKRPVASGLRDGHAGEAYHVNTTCGDEVTVRVHLSASPEDGSVLAPADVTLTDFSYDATGCSISMAATSMLAQEAIGESVAESLDVYRGVQAMLTSRGQDPGDVEEIGDAVALAGVSKYPARVKCALLGWSAYLDALARAGVDISSVKSSAKTP
ncbi:Fe-S cluster assembly sulfur transfer protein SufU [Ornithinimicrobium sp. INDO-MA30-4]|uniref:Fe-S cluster assembly sulfur transfer protein SufU n=1 Tax=Ornithinimicrobium sp. INDO-MA30-4 TaxID=2908651 RepID=UPI001F4769E0|nr:SUF system NifU family Fe-S cluster assembly protein [Ornithinimicrobium sp. INDO-MA30-4]UJH71044.1 SUF system NifU family Fe-S cluster assembly protein [Ornithinimicrobium sp. INDO-MA30-4]